MALGVSCQKMFINRLRRYRRVKLTKLVNEYELQKDWTPEELFQCRSRSSNINRRFFELSRKAPDMNDNGKCSFPWLDSEGNPLSNEQLKMASINWTSKDWDRFLDASEPSLSEKQIDVGQYDRLASIQSESVFSCAQESASVELYARLQNALRALTVQQYSVIEILFFKLKSHREAARELSISQSRVRDLRNHALKKLKSELQRGGTHFALSR